MANDGRGILIRLTEYGMAVLSLATTSRLPLRGYRHPVRIFSQARAVLP